MVYGKFRDEVQEEQAHVMGNPKADSRTWTVLSSYLEHRSTQRKDIKVSVGDRARKRMGKARGQA